MAQEKQKDNTSITQRKKILNDELKRLENRMQSDFGDIRSDVDTYLHPKKVIKKHPLGSLGLSLLIGFLLSKSLLKGKSNNRVTHVDLNGQYMPAIPAKAAGKKEGLGSMIMGEIKRYIARKGTEWTMHQLEEKIKEFNQKKEEQQ